MKVLVTGASGFVGGYVCRELRERGHDVSALVRRPGSAPTNVAEVEGDLASDGDALARAVAAATPECVIHLAAEIASQRSAKRIRAVNVDGTRRLLAACRAAGSPRFVFASTVVTGDARGALLDEQSELPVETAYGRSKQEGERLVRESGLATAIVRPSHVYGAGGWYADEFVARLRQPGRFALIGRGDNWWDVVRVEDVASALGVGPPRSIPAPIARIAGGRDPVLRHPLGPLEQRADQARARLVPPLPELGARRPGRDSAAELVVSRAPSSWRAWSGCGRRSWQRRALGRLSPAASRQ